MKILKLAFKNMKNNKLRTGLTVLGVAVAVFVFAFFQSMQATMQGVVTEAGENNNLLVLEQNTWWPTQSELPDSYARKLAENPQVEDAMPVYISTTSCWAFEPDKVIVHGIDKDKFEKFRDYKLTSGSMEEFKSTRDGALLGASIAERKGWKTGDSVDLRDQLGIMMTVSGIFFSGNEDQDNTILADIEYVQDQYDGRGKANSIMVKLEQGAKSDEVAAAIDKMDGPVGTGTQAETAYVSGMIEDLNDMISLSALVILITLAVVFVSVANTISMSVRDRTRQIGMMRTLGFKRWMVMFMVVAEAAMICLLGGVVGTGGAWLLLMMQDVTVQARSLNLVVAMPWTVIAWALIVSFGIGVVGSLIPGFRASRMKMVDAIGSAE